MAVDFKARLEERKKSRQSTTTNGVDFKKRRLERAIGLDTLETDLKSANESLSNIMSGWQNTETMKSARSTTEKMYNRLNDYKTYLGDSASKDLDTVISVYSDALSNWDDISKLYSGYANAGAYNKAKNYSVWADEYAGLTYKEAQEKAVDSAYSEEQQEFFRRYGVNAGYNDLNEYNKELMRQREALLRMNEGDSEYKAQKKYIEELEAAKNVYELDHKSDEYKHLMSNKDFEELSKYTPKQYEAYPGGAYKIDSVDLAEYINGTQDIKDAYNRHASLYEMYMPSEKGYDYLTDEEISIYNYLHNTDREAAEKFLEDMEITLGKRLNEANAEKINAKADDSILSSIGMSLASIPSNLLGGAVGLVDDVASKIQGKDINPYSAGHSLINYASNVRGAVGDNISEGTGDVARFLYDTAMSMGDSVLGGALGGSGAGVLLGASAAEIRAKELMEQGASEGEVVAGALLAGAFEWLFEKASLDNLFKAKDIDTVGRLVKDALKQSGIEASEEIFTELANTLTDTIIRGNMSDVMQSYHDYIDRGFDQSEALGKVALDVTKNVALAGLGGALSGGVLGGTFNTVRYADASQGGKIFETNKSMDELYKLAGTYEADSETGKLFKEYEDRNVKSLTKAQANKLTAAMLADGANNSVESVLKKKGFNDKHIARIMDIADRAYRGETITAEEQSVIESEDIQAAYTTVQERQNRLKKLNNLINRVTTTNEGKKVEIEAVNEAGEIKTNKGTYTEDELILSDSDKIQVYARDLPAEVAEVYKEQYEASTMNPGEYDTRFRLIYGLAESGASIDSVIRSKGNLTSNQIMSIYRMGLKANTAKTALKKSKLKYTEYIGEGQFDDSAIDYSKLTDRQREEIEIIRAITEKLGLKVRLFESPVVNGKRVGKNGSRAADGTIEIDVYAGTINVEDFRSAMLSVFAHELTHMIENQAPTEYKKLVELATDVLTRDGRHTLDELIAAEKEKYAKNHDGAKLSTEGAVAELVARTFEDMLNDSAYIKEVLANADVSTIKTIKDTLWKIVEDIKEWLHKVLDTLSSYRSESKEAQVLREYSKELEKAHRLWDEGLKEAIAVKQEALKDEQYSDRKSEERDLFYRIDNDGMVVIDAPLYTKDDIESDYDSVKELVKESLNLLKGKSDVIASDNRLVYYDRTTKNEYMNSKDTRGAKKGKKYAKFNATLALREVVARAKEPSWEKNKEEKHDKDAARGWTKYVVKFGIELEDVIKTYVGKLHVRMDESGMDYVYDITNIKEEMVKADTNSINAIAPHRPSLHEEIVSHSKDIVKEQFSDRDDSYIDMKRLQEENEQLRADVNLLKEKLKLMKTVTGGKIIKPSSLDFVAKKLIHDTGSKIDKTTLIEKLNDVYSYIMTAETVDWDEMYSKAFRTAQDILDKAESKIVDDYAKIILNDIRNTKLMVSEGQMAEAIRYIGSKKEVYQSVFGKFRMSESEGISLDSKWAKWAAQYPEVFDADITPENQLTELLNVYDVLRESSVTIERYNTIDNVRALGVEIYNHFWDIVPLETFEDKHQQEIKRLKFEHRKAMDKLKAKMKKERAESDSRHKQIVEQVKKRYTDREQNIKQQGKKALERYRERQKQKEVIDKITKKSKSLMDWLNTNSKAKHVTDVLKRPLGEFLACIDFSSDRYLYGGEATQRDLEMRDAMMGVKNAISKINKSNTGAEVFDDIYGYLDMPEGFADLVSDLYDRVVQLTDTSRNYVLNDMSVEELEALDEVITVLKTTLSKSNEMLANPQYALVDRTASGSIGYLDKMGERKNANKIKNYFIFDNATPITVFERFGEGGMLIFNEFADGFDKLAFIVRDILEFTRQTYTPKEVRSWSDEVHEFSVSGKTIKLTVTQMMSMYCLSKREQGLQHLKGGGIRADYKKSKGIVKNEGTIQKTTLTAADISKILSELTPRQMEVADKLQNFMSTYCASLGNEISLMRFGKRDFMEEYYFPIEVDKNNIASKENDNAKQNSLYRLLNMSFSKQLTPKASNRIVINDIFDVFAQHTSDMAKYNALGLPILDALKWFNYKEKGEIFNEDGNYETVSIKEKLEAAFGTGAETYFKKFIEDINGANTGGYDASGSFANMMIRNAKLASVAANLRVVALQPTSYVRALAVLDAKYLTPALAMKGKPNMAEKYCGLALWKSFGFYNTDIARSVTSLIKNDVTLRDKVVDVSLKAAEVMDKLTLGKLWNACELEVKDKTDLAVGSEEYYQAVGKRLREVICRTQVVDSTLTRSQTMRSKNEFAKVYSAFMSEPTVAYNLLLNCFEEFADAKRQYGTGTALKRSGRKIARATSAYCLTALASSLVGAVANAFRDMDEDKDFSEKFINEIIDELVGNLLIVNNIPIVSQLYSSVIEGWQSSRMDMQFFDSIGPTIKKIVKWSNGEGGITTYEAAYVLLKTVSYGSGIPGSNFLREVQTIWNNTIGEIYDMKIK